MADDLAEVENLLLRRWADAVAFREAMAEVEGRLGTRLDAAAESLRPWLEERGYDLYDVDKRNASIRIVRSSWLHKEADPWVWIALSALLPYGYRKVDEEHPHVWVATRGLDKDDRTVFQERLNQRLRGKESEWLNEDCSRDYPAGRYIPSHGDRERSDLARSSDAIADFAREALLPVLALGDDIEAALNATRGRWP